MCRVLSSCNLYERLGGAMRYLLSLSIISSLLLASCSTLTKPKLESLNSSSANFIDEMSIKEREFEKGVAVLRGSNDFLQLLEFGGTVFGAYTALFTGSTDLQEAALITASAGGADSLLDHSDKMETVFRARRRMTCTANAALNVKIAVETASSSEAQSEKVAEIKANDKKESQILSGSASSGAAPKLANISEPSTLAKTNWKNTVTAVWNDIRTRFNNDWDGSFTDNTDAINKFEEAIKAINTPQPSAVGNDNGNESTVGFTDKEFNESIVKLLKCPLIQ